MVFLVWARFGLAVLSPLSPNTPQRCFSCVALLQSCLLSALSSGSDIPPRWAGQAPGSSVTAGSSGTNSTDLTGSTDSPGPRSIRLPGFPRRLTSGEIVSMLVSAQLLNNQRQTEQELHLHLKYFISPDCKLKSRSTELSVNPIIKERRYRETVKSNSYLHCTWSFVASMVFLSFWVATQVFLGD